MPLLKKDFNKKFDLWIKKAKIQIIPTEKLTIGKVFIDYFANNPPFQEGEKKHEFPDAFSFLALQEYFVKKAEKCYFVTSDKDFDSMGTVNILPIKEVREKIDIILREHEKPSKILQLIDKGYQENKLKLEKEAHKMIFEYLEEEVPAQGEIDGMLIDVLDKIDLSAVEFTDYKIVFLGEFGARLEYQANFAYELSIAVEDNSQAFYDKEDDVYYGTEHFTYVHKDSREENFSVVIDFDLDSDDVEIEVEDINDGKGFEVFERMDDYYYK